MQKFMKILQNFGEILTKFCDIPGKVKSAKDRAGAALPLGEAGRVEGVPAGEHARRLRRGPEGLQADRAALHPVCVGLRPRSLALHLRKNALHLLLERFGIESYSDFQPNDQTLDCFFLGCLNADFYNQILIV